MLVRGSKPLSFPGLSLPAPHLSSLISSLAALPACTPHTATDTLTTQDSAIQPCLSIIAVTGVPNYHPSVWWLPTGPGGGSWEASALSSCPSCQPLQEGKYPACSKDERLVLGEHPETQGPIDLSSPVTTHCIRPPVPLVYCDLGSPSFL